jgi:lipopolysaccharide biosynthesis protein
MGKKIRALALYLPQFHPIPENDEWWGKGFTDWKNVVTGKSIFKGQYQPHLPADLGFYDLRVPDIRKQQADLAKNYGIYGFCYYHYWFNGKRLLERPFTEVLKSKQPDFPFCLCWANENWSRNWDGKFNDILIQQKYSLEDDLNHIRYLGEEVFPDERYIKIDEKPVFIIYRPLLFPNLKATVSTWRSEIKKMGFKDIYLIFFWSFDYGINPTSIGFDAAAQFTPNKLPFVRKKAVMVEKLREINYIIPRKLKFLTIQYKDVVSYYRNFQYPNNFILFPCITPMWDNYVRRKNKGGTILLNSTPELYKNWLENICERWEPQSSEENFIFINAWNEWAEGNHLEPCENWGTQYLEKTLEVLKNYK